MIIGFGLLAMLACAVFYYRLGAHEHSSGALLSGVSVLLWIVSGYFLGLGVLGCILVQAGLFIVLWLVNIFRDKAWK